MTSGISNASMPPDWACALVDAQAFDREQSRLAQVWTFLGFTQDVANEGDWFRASLATRSVFVQRFGDVLKGFENRCAHRSFPLRTTENGNGPIVCGFHHWRYDQEGRALGIPMCQELFGMTPRELGAKLVPVEIATCGSFVFGRFPASGANESLEQFLGDGFPILEQVSRLQGKPRGLTTLVQANWRLCYHITLDDYHSVAVHPSTFGKNGYPHRDNMGYFRFASHSAFLSTPDKQAMTKMVAGCRDGTYRSSNYFILQIFPNLIVSHGRSDAQYWQLLVQQYLPAAHNRSLHRSWVYPAPFAADHAWHHRWSRPFTDPWRALAVRYFIGKVRDEDHAVCERIQAIAHQIETLPIFGALEERIVWFEEAYAKAMAAEIR
jgi:phenylpropionate dioxygenase-like ring-hydroxylating dioxygenase large terminal subunit